MRVLVVTPTWGGQMSREMRTALNQALEAARGAGMVLEHLVLDDQPFPPPDHRNVLHMYRIAHEKALAGKYDVMWTVEHDVVVPPDAALKLAETPGDVVYGIYMVRWGDCNVINVLEFLDDKNIGESLMLFPEKLAAARQAGVVRCSGVGWGCTWIRKRTLRKLALPVEWSENPPYDITFAQRAIRAKLELNAHFGVLCGHMRNGKTIRPDFDMRIMHNGAAWMVGGQLLPMYKPYQPQQTVPVPAPVRRSPKTSTIQVAPMPEAWHDIPQPSSGGGTEIVALKTIYARVNGESMRLRYGVRYELPADVAHELARAGYVEVRSVS